MKKVLDPFKILPSDTVVVQFAQEPLVPNLVESFGEVHDQDIGLIAFIQIVMKIADKA